MDHMHANSDEQKEENALSSNYLLSSTIESFRLPLDSSMPIIFTGYFNCYNVEVKSVDEIALLYHMGCFGKGSKSRSKPKVQQSQGSMLIMRTRQYQKRNFWYKKFCGIKGAQESDDLIKSIIELSGKIVTDSINTTSRDVIDLISSEDDEHYPMSNNDDTLLNMNSNDNVDTVVIVSDSDSEEENYFANLKPKCCINKTKIQEKLILTLQEAFFLLYGLGCLQIVDDSNELLDIQLSWHKFIESDAKFDKKYIVYHYYRSKGYIVKPGIKYGGDYLLYREGPGFNHADYIVVIKLQENFNLISILGHVRMAITTVKEIIITEVIIPEGILVTPENLQLCSVREVFLNRNIPMTINDEFD